MTRTQHSGLEQRPAQRRRAALFGASFLAIGLALASHANAQVVVNNDVLDALAGGGGGGATGVPTYSVYGGLQFPPQDMPRSFSNVDGRTVAGGGQSYAGADQGYAPPTPQAAPQPEPQQQASGQSTTGALPSQAAQQADTPEDMSEDPAAQPAPEPQPEPQPEPSAAAVATPPSPPEPEPAPAPEPAAQPQPDPAPAPEPEETAVAEVATPPSPPEPEPAPAPEPEPEAAAEPAPEPEPAPETAEQPAEPESEETQTAALTVGEVEGGVRVLFGEGESELPGDAEGPLRELARELLQDDSLRVQLLAYAPGDDSETSRARRLSLSRALEVRGFLIDQGVRSTRMDVRALGNNLPEGGAPADRVDIVPADR